MDHSQHQGHEMVGFFLAVSEQFLTVILLNPECVIIWTMHASIWLFTIYEERTLKIVLSCLKHVIDKTS